jgi:hypothetical protein
LQSQSRQSHHQSLALSLKLQQEQTQKLEQPSSRPLQVLLLHRCFPPPWWLRQVVVHRRICHHPWMLASV